MDLCLHIPGSGFGAGGAGAGASGLGAGLGAVSAIKRAKMSGYYQRIKCSQTSSHFPPAN